MLGVNLLRLVFCVAALHIIDTEGLEFTDGTPITKEYADGTAKGETITLMTDADATFSLTGTDAASFSVAPLKGADSVTAGTTATVTVTGDLDHATKSSYIFTVTAMATANSETDTIDVTVNIVLVLVFESKIYAATVCETVTEGRQVTKVTAIPIEGRTVAYSITDGNTDTTFEISTTGVISVATGKTVDKADTPYTLIVTATDDSSPTAQTDIATVTVAVSGSCSGTSTITGSLAAMLCMTFCVFKKLFE